MYTKLWNDFALEIRESDSIGSFKRALANHYNVPKYCLPFDYALDRYSSVIHSRLWLDACGLNYYLFKIAFKSSPICSCDFDNETRYHFFYSVLIMLPSNLISHCCCSYSF